MNIVKQLSISTLYFMNRYLDFGRDNIFASNFAYCFKTITFVIR